MFLGACFTGWLPLTEKSGRPWLLRPAVLTGLALLFHGAVFVTLVERFF